MSAESRTCIRGATVATAAGEAGARDLYLRGEHIEGFEAGGPVDETIDADGLLLTPAFVDPHVHLRDPGQEAKEDLATGLAAAAAGGYGTVVSMANTEPVIDAPEMVRALIERARALPGARLRPAAALTQGLRGERLVDVRGLAEAGAVLLTDDGEPVRDGGLLRRGLEEARAAGLPVQTHAEDPSLRGDGVMHEGEVSERLGLPGNPDAAEAAMIHRDCEIARLTGAHLHVAHVSSRRGLQVVEFFKAQGAPVTCEVTPHHLTLDHTALEGFDPVYKVAPPLREAEDVAYLVDAVARGVVDAFGSDHAPHTLAEKDQDLIRAPFGIANLEVAVALLYTELVASGALALPAFLHLLQTGPARFLGLPAPTLEPGAPADVVLLDPHTPRAVDPATFRSKARRTPWDGAELRGWPVRTWTRGRSVFERGGHVADAR